MKKYILFTFACFFFFLSSVRGKSLYLQMNEVEIKPGSEIVLSLYAGEENIKSGLFTVIADSSHLDLVSVTSETLMLERKDHTIAFTSDHTLSKEEVIATIVYRVSSNAPLSLKTNLYLRTIFITYENGEEEKVEDVSFPISLTQDQIPSYLRELSSQIVFIPFVKEQFIYRVTVPSDTEKMDLTAKGEDINAQIQVGNEILEVGENVIPVEVQAPGKGKTTYQIYVTREEEPAVSKKAVKEPFTNMHFFLLISIFVVIIDVIYMFIRKRRG